MRHHDGGPELAKPPGHAPDQAGVEALGGTITAGIVEGLVDAHFVGAVEQAEHDVAPSSGPAEAVGDGPCLALRAAAHRRGNDVNNERRSRR